MKHYTRKDSSWLTANNIKSQANSTIHSKMSYLQLELFCNFAASYYSNIGAVRHFIFGWYGVRPYDTNTMANNLYLQFGFYLL